MTLIKTHTQYLTIVTIAALYVRPVDTVLADLMLAACDADTPEAWAAVHDRLNVLGRFDGADRIRRLVHADKK